MKYKEILNKSFFKDSEEFVRCNKHKAHLTMHELEHFIETEIIEKLIEDSSQYEMSELKRAAMVKQLRERWL